MASICSLEVQGFKLRSVATEPPLSVVIEVLCIVKTIYFTEQFIRFQILLLLLFCAADILKGTREQR